MIHRQVTEHAGFNLNFLGIGLPLHFVAGFQFLLRHYAYRLEHTDAFGLQIVVEDERYTGFAVQTAFFGLGFPFVAVAVTVEVNGLAYPDVFTDNVEDSRNLRFTLPDKFVYILLEFYQLLGKSGVQGNHGAGAVGFRTYGTKLEAVARKGKRAGTVSVGVVYHQFGYLRNVQLHALFAAEADEVVLSAFLNMFQYLAQLLAEEAGYDCRRRFVRSQSVGVCGAGDAGFQ